MYLLVINKSVKEVVCKRSSYIYIYYMLVSNKSCCTPSQGPNTSFYSTKVSCVAFEMIYECRYLSQGEPLKKMMNDEMMTINPCVILI